MVSPANSLADCGAPATGNFLAPSANIVRLNDRVMVATATQNPCDGTTAGDWTQTTFSGIFAYLQKNAQFAVGPTHGQLAGFFSGRASDGGGGASAAIIPVSVLAVNDHTAAGSQGVFGYYGTLVRTSDSNGSATFGIELDIANQGASVKIDPYGGIPGETICILLNSGGELTLLNGQTFNPVTAGLVMGTNNLDAGAYGNVKFNSGIIINQDAIAFTSRQSTTGDAIALAKGHAIQWYSAQNVQCGAIYNTNASASNYQAADMQFIAGGIRINEASTGNPCCLINTGNAINPGYITIYGGADPNYSQIVASSSVGGNQNLYLRAAGSGLVAFGTYTAGAPAATGYITVMDLNGGTYKLLTGT